MIDNLVSGMDARGDTGDYGVGREAGEGRLLNALPREEVKKKCPL